MSTTPIPIDISNNKDLLRLAEEVKKSRTPRELKKDNETVAVLMPVSKQANTRKPTKLWALYSPTQVKEALKQSAGALEGVDRAQLLTDLAEQA